MADQEITREHIINVLIELDSQSTKTVGRTALEKLGINQHQIAKHIPEGTTALKKQLGLKVSRQEDPHQPDDLLEKLDRVTSSLQKIPTWKELRLNTGGITEKVYIGHFGKRGQKEVLIHYRDWLKDNKPESENIELVEEHLRVEPKSKNAPRLSLNKKKSGAKKTKKEKNPKKTQYGRILNFAGMEREPVNEQGVVALFAIICKQLDFSIKHVQQGFPDCEAIAHFNDGTTQEVTIEFEFKSRNYHHPEGEDDCDYIVCWEDNWGDKCPIEVIELKKEVRRLRKIKLPEFEPIK